MMKRLWVLLVWLSALAAQAEDEQLTALFAEHGLTGTLLIQSLDGSQQFSHNDARAAEPLAIASTFKILNSLIALDAGVIEGADSRFRWDGTRHEIASWNGDQTLASAFAVSCVWCYQQLALKVGAERYRQQLKALGFGQLDEPLALTSFWLNGQLRISAQQQIAFLRRLVTGDLPFKSEHQATVRTIMVVERGDDYLLRAKTGWAVRVTPQVGWYVGYVERGGATWLFALNMTIRSPADLPLRQQLVMAGLRAKGILPRPVSEGR